MNQEMKVFVEVARSGSFSEAARRLQQTPSAISKLITRMEARLGTRLFNRTTRHLGLTEGGSEYYNRCLQILIDIDEAENLLTGYQEEARGRLTVTCSPAFAKYRLTPRVADFLREHPQLELRLMISSDNLDLIENNIDVAIRHGSLKDSSLVARHLTESRFVVCASPHYLEEFGTPRQPEQLEQHNCLHAPISNTGGLWHFSRRGREQAVEVSGNFTCDTVEHLKELALGGAGIVNLADFVVEKELQDGRLQALLTQYETQALPLHLVYAHRERVPNKVRQFIDFMREAA